MYIYIYLLSGLSCINMCTDTHELSHTTSERVAGIDNMFKRRNPKSDLRYKTGSNATGQVAAGLEVLLQGKLFTYMTINIRTWGVGKQQAPLETCIQGLNICTPCLPGQGPTPSGACKLKMSRYSCNPCSGNKGCGHPGKICAVVERLAGIARPQREQWDEGKMLEGQQRTPREIQNIHKVLETHDSYD